ncbi:MAG: DUF444 family protein [Candidatus Spechtbacterales bacterium]
MPITVPEPVAQRGKKDARRHRDKQREAIRERLPEIISKESIITRKNGKTVKVPIRSIDIPHFRPGARKQTPGGQGEGEGAGGVGVGQGPGKPGDVIGRRPGKGQPGPDAGSEPGQDYIESEIDLEELIAMMLEDLGLPNLEKKKIAELEVIFGFKIRGISKSGPRILLDPTRSSKTPFGRFWAFLQILQDETGRDELTCFSALKKTEGNLGEALEVLRDPNFSATEDEVEPFGIYHEEDLRYHKIKEDVRHESNAVVIAMMDVSGSMTTMKKYLARSLLFWLVEFLRTIYNKVEIRFVIHHATARLVPEEEFFHTAESGGTKCASAYELANSLIDSQYPTGMWNVYAFHFSDGEDFEPEEAMREAKKFFDKGINMFGYGEIRVDEHYRSYSNLFPAFVESFPIVEGQSPVEGGAMKMYSGRGDFPFIGVVIEGRHHIWPALREFLKKDRWLVS